MEADAQEVLEFWLGDSREDPARAEERKAFWFLADRDTDATISERFAKVVVQARGGRLSSWADQPRARLALIILLDQFSRNLYRATPAAFDHDATALRLAQQGVAAGQLDGLSVVEQAFFLMPYEHSEEAAVQREGVRLFQEILARASPRWKPCARGFLSFANQHLEIVERFGRMPHRNAILGRASTAEERAFLDAGGESFGQTR